METVVGIIVVLLVGAVTDHAIERAVEKREWNEAVRIEQAEWAARAEMVQR